MSVKRDFHKMADAARRAREEQATREAEAKTEELERVAGEAHVEFEDLFERGDLDHTAKVARYQAATALLRGENMPVQGAASVPVAGTDLLDLSSLSDAQREVIELVRDNPKRFKIEPFGAVKDKQYTQLKLNYDAEQARGKAADETSTTEPPAAPAKKTAANAAAKPAKKVIPPAKEEVTETSKSLKERARDAGLSLFERNPGRDKR